MAEQADQDCPYEYFGGTVWSALIALAESRSTGIQDLEAKVRRLERKSVRAAAEAPEKDLLLHRYQRRLDGDIQRFVRELRGD